MPVDSSETECLLLHGWGFSAGVWQPLIEQLDGRIRCRAITLPGYDDTGADEQTTTIEMIIEQLAAQLGSSTIVIGWSLGGLLAVELAWRYPDRIGALGMVAALPCFNRQPGWTAGWDAGAVAAVHDRLQQDAAAACRYVAALAARGDDHGHDIKQTLNATAVVRARVLQRDLDYLRTADMREAFAALEMPIHVWLGNRDALIGGDCAAALHALQPTAEIHEFRHAGHAPLLSRPRQIAHDLARKLELLQ